MFISVDCDAISLYKTYNKNVVLYAKSLNDWSYSWLRIVRNSNTVIKNLIVILLL